MVRDELNDVMVAKFWDMTFRYGTFSCDHLVKLLREILMQTRWIIPLTVIQLCMTNQLQHPPTTTSKVKEVEIRPHNLNNPIARLPTSSTVPLTCLSNRIKLNQTENRNPTKLWLIVHSLLFCLCIVGRYLLSSSSRFHCSKSPCIHA